jgi:anti-anti-sigma regulatory factor
VRLDLSGLVFMDSTGLRVILQRLKVGPVTLVGTSPRILQMIELCGLAEQNGLTFEGWFGSDAVKVAAEGSLHQRRRRSRRWTFMAAV